MQFILKISKTSTSRTVFFFLYNLRFCPFQKECCEPKARLVTDVFLLSALGSCWCLEAEKRPCVRFPTATTRGRMTTQSSPAAESAKRRRVSVNCPDRTCDPVACSPPGPLSVRLPRREYRSGLPCPPPGDLPNEGSNPRLLYCRQVLHHLSRQEADNLLSGRNFSKAVSPSRGLTSTPCVKALSDDVAGRKAAWSDQTCSSVPIGRAHQRSCLITWWVLKLHL